MGRLLYPEDRNGRQELPRQVAVTIQATIPLRTGVGLLRTEAVLPIRAVIVAEARTTAATVTTKADFGVYEPPLAKTFVRR